MNSIYKAYVVFFNDELKIRVKYLLYIFILQKEIPFDIFYKSIT